MLSSISWSGLSASAWWSPSGLDQSPPPPPSVTYREYDGGEEVVVFGRRGGSEPGFGAYGGLTGPAENSARNARWAAMSPQERVMAMGLDPFATIESDARFEQASFGSPMVNLQAHEGGPHKGHTLRDHVGKTYAELMDRIQSEGLEKASSFSSRFEAELVLGAIMNSPEFLSASRQALDRGDNGMIFRWLEPDATTGIGTVVHADGTEHAGKGVRLVLKRDPAMASGWVIFTAFPID
jgi:hypothetical protein